MDYIIMTEQSKYTKEEQQLNLENNVRRAGIFYLFIIFTWVGLALYMKICAEW